MITLSLILTIYPSDSFGRNNAACPRNGSKQCFFIISITTRNFEANFYRSSINTDARCPSFINLYLADFIRAQNFTVNVLAPSAWKKTHELKNDQQINNCLYITTTGSLKWYGIAELQSTLQKIRNDLSQKTEARSVQNFHERPQACVGKAGRHYEHFISQTFLS